MSASRFPSSASAPGRPDVLLPPPVRLFAASRVIRIRRSIPASRASIRRFPSPARPPAPPSTAASGALPLRHALPPAALSRPTRSPAPGSLTPRPTLCRHRRASTRRSRTPPRRGSGADAVNGHGHGRRPCEETPAPRPPSRSPLGQFQTPQPNAHGVSGGRGTSLHRGRALRQPTSDPLSGEAPDPIVRPCLNPIRAAYAGQQDYDFFPRRACRSAARGRAGARPAGIGLRPVPSDQGTLHSHLTQPAIHRSIYSNMRR